MKAYLRSVVVGLVAAIVVAVFAWVTGVGPRVSQRVFPPPRPSSPVQAAPAREAAVDLSVAVGTTIETDYVFPRSEQTAVLFAFVAGVAWTVRRNRHHSRVA
jgi:hypothetical protein